MRSSPRFDREAVFVENQGVFGFCRFFHSRGVEFVEVEGMKFVANDLEQRGAGNERKFI